jgi:hypothetical protein
MARPLNKHPFGETEKDCWMTFARIASDPLPHDSKRLRNIIEALISRLNKKNPREARYLRSHLHRLAGMEDRFPLHSAEQYAAASAQRRRRLEEADRIAKKLLQSVEEEVFNL